MKQTRHGMIMLVLGVIPLLSQTQLTVYNHGEALVKETFTAPLKAGLNVLTKDQVAEAIIPASVKLSSHGELQILEQNYQYDLVDQDRLLKKYLGSEVTVVQQNGDKLSGSLLSFDDRTLVVNGKNGVEIAQRNYVASIRCPAPREKLVTHPTLEWHLDVPRATEYELELSYLTRGLGWKAEYVAELSADNTVLNLSSWIDLDNRSGATYTDARLKLVAGELHRARQVQNLEKKYMTDVMLTRGAQQPVVETREFFEYHLYEIGFPVTVRDKEQKQVQWLSPRDIAAEKRLIFQDGGPEFSNLMAKVRFRNDKQQGTGVALPAGIVRLFSRDTDGSLELIGEDNLDHTSKDDEVLLSIGETFDVKGKREILNRDTKTGRFREEQIRITIANRKDAAVEVDIIESMGWSNWDLRNASHPWTQLDARRAQFTVKVAANSEEVVTYTYFQSYK